MAMDARIRTLWQQGLARDLAALALLLVLCLLFFWPVLTPNLEDRGSFREGDFYVQTYACSTYKAREIMKGHYPLWNPYVYSGHPFLADVQNSPLYPPALLTILLSSPHYSVLALELEAIVHFFLAGAFAYFLGRRLFRHRGIALIVAVTFSFGGYLTSFPPLQLPVLETAIWLPLILLLLDLGSAKFEAEPRLAFFYCFLAGLAWGVAILAGHPQTAMYLFYTSVAWYAFRNLSIGRGLLMLRFGGLVAFAGVGGGVAAAQLLPAAELMRLSVRASATYQDLASGFALKDLLQVLLPGSVGFWSPLYIGIFPLLWVLFAWASWFRTGESAPSHRWRRDVAFWTVLALLALLLAFGGETFLYSIFYLLVPGFGLFRSQERISLVFSLSLALLSGYGLRHYLTLVAQPPGTTRTRAILSKITLALLVGLGGLALLLFFGSTRASVEQGRLMADVLGLVFFIGVLLGGGWLWSTTWAHTRWRAGPALSLLLVIIVFDLFTLNSRTNIQGRLPERQVRSTPIIQALQTADSERPFRVHHGGYYLPENYGCVFEVEDTGGASQLHLADYARFLEKVPMERAWELLNVQYVVTWQAALSVPSDVAYHTTTRHGDEVYLHHLQIDAPRAWAVFQTKVAAPDQILKQLSLPAFEPYHVALLDAPLDPPLIDQPDSRAVLRFAPLSSEHLRIEADMPARGLVVLSELDYPGWQAHVDGRQVPIHRVNGLLRAIVVPAGVHRVEMEYRPVSVYVGATVSVLTCILVLGYTIWVGASVRSKGQNS